MTSCLNLCRLFLVLALLPGELLAQHEHHGRGPMSAHWSNLPMLNASMARGGPPAVRVEAGGFDRVLLQTPENPEPVELSAEQGGWVVRREQMGTGGHLWFQALRHTEHEITGASSYFFFPAKHQVPTQTLQSPRPGLDIVPLRLPEHGGVREGSTWKFLIRHDNLPLANVEVSFETEGGSRTQLRSDHKGELSVPFPHDFSAAKLAEKEAMSSRQGFVLAVRHAANGQRYLSTYSHYYHPDRMRQKSLAGGVAALAGGMLLALPLIRRKEKKRA